MISKEQYMNGLSMYHNKIKVSLASGMMSAEDKAKLDSLASITGAGDNVTISGGIISAGMSSVILGTAASSVNGALWYEMTDNQAFLKLRHGDYVYSFKYDAIQNVNFDEYLIAYLPLTESLEDACGNEWKMTKQYNPPKPEGDAGTYFDEGSCLYNETLSDYIDTASWTIDFWASIIRDRYEGRLFANSSVALRWDGGNITLDFNDTSASANAGLSERSNYHYAVTYDRNAIRLFIDGVLKIERECKITMDGTFAIASDSELAHKACGNIARFRIFKGSVLWVEDFTPPTAEDY